MELTRKVKSDKDSNQIKSDLLSLIGILSCYAALLGMITGTVAFKFHDWQNQESCYVNVVD